ncbi:hypothetical protein PM04_13450 [Thalassobacter sp. 16PALIMAR09]|nr:hypothetical protein PM04_13450 [Thalassobacter sp. 16PALIMAR09]
MTGETDGGLAFGATIDLDDALEAGGGADTRVTAVTTDTSDTGAALDPGTLTTGTIADADGGQGIGDNSDDDSIDYTIFVSGAFGTLTFGDTDGAMDWALTEGGNVGNPGSLNDAETSYAGYAGSYLDGNGDGMIARYDYSFGDYAFAVSVEQGVADAENGFAVGFKGNVAGVSFGIAHQAGTENATGDAELTGVSLGYGFGALNAGIMVATGEDRVGADRDLMQIGLGYSAGALSLHANYAEDDVDGTGKADGIGVAAKYDLGGGAGVHFGYSSSETAGGVDADRWSLGLAMSF